MTTSHGNGYGTQSISNHCSVGIHKLARAVDRKQTYFSGWPSVERGGGG